MWKAYVMFAYVNVLVITLLSSVLGSPETEGVQKINKPEVVVPLQQQDWWKWQNNPLYSDYWQRDQLRRPWTQRPSASYPFTYGPDAQYTHQIYDTPEYFGYDANYPGGMTHFIGYKTQGRKQPLGPGKDVDPATWNNFLHNGPTTEVPQFLDGSKHP